MTGKRFACVGCLYPGCCGVCDGSGRVAVDEAAIRKAVISSQGPNRYNLRISNSGMRACFGAEYVWGRLRGDASPKRLWDVGVLHLETEKANSPARRLLAELDRIADRIEADLADDVDVAQLKTRLARR